MGDWDPVDIMTMDHHIPESAELSVLDMNAWLNTDAYGMTDKLIKRSFRAELVRIPQDEEGIPRMESVLWLTPRLNQRGILTLASGAFRCLTES